MGRHYKERTALQEQIDALKEAISKSAISASIPSASSEDSGSFASANVKCVEEMKKAQEEAEMYQSVYLFETIWNSHYQQKCISLQQKISQLEEELNVSNASTQKQKIQILQRFKDENNSLKQQVSRLSEQLAESTILNHKLQNK